jgi:hypothetical protein
MSDPPKIRERRPVEGIRRLFRTGERPCAVAPWATAYSATSRTS